ncbi:MAG TPA: sigma-70 family RNA polymerase sigma factor [Solirubrobacteraceae bacterium]|nr:sigma-70 family RNA polymerase sigma factor [Solirubrobacteraceae bacterium]
MMHCLVPCDLGGEVLEALRAALPPGCGTRVVVERRVRARRRADDRRAAEGHVANDRRRVRNATGRRVADRRAAAHPAEVPVLPPHLAPYAHRLRFVRVEPLSETARDDHDSARIVVRVQAGDRDAFSELYLRYFDGIYGYLRIALRDEHEAEDATQDVFLQAFRALPRYELRGQPPRRWLYRIARNVAIDRGRRVRALPQDPAALEARTDAEPVDEFDELLSDAALVAHIERLPEAQREVLFLRYAAGFEAPEIARMTRRSPAAVRQLHHRAIAELRRRLSGADALAVA